MDFSVLDARECHRLRRPQPIPLSDAAKALIREILGSLVCSPELLDSRQVKLHVVSAMPGCVKQLLDLGFQHDLDHQHLVFAKADSGEVERFYLKLIQ